jgi:hypothetical protein
MRIGPIAPPATSAGASPPETNPPRGPRSFAAVLGEQVGATADPAVKTEPPGGAITKPMSPSGNGARAMLERVVSTENRLDTLLQAAARGKTFSPGELLALQASVFRYSQTVEVASRVADRLVGAIKQTVGTSV